MATRCLFGPSSSVRILPGCWQGQSMGCQGGSHEKGSCWDNGEKTYIHPHANDWDVLGAGGRALRLAVRGWQRWVKEWAVELCPEALGMTTQRHCSVLGIRVTLDIAVNVPLWQSTHGKNSMKKELTLGLSFGGFCPWLADGFFLDHGEVDHCGWRVQKTELLTSW